MCRVRLYDRISFILQSIWHGTTPYQVPVKAKGVQAPYLGDFVALNGYANQALRQTGATVMYSTPVPEY